MIDGTIVPRGWRERYHRRGDLEASCSELDRSRHFYAHGLRGRILSLLMRPEEAVRAFRAASRALELHPRDNALDFGRTLQVEAFMDLHWLTLGQVEATALERLEESAEWFERHNRQGLATTSRTVGAQVAIAIGEVEHARGLILRVQSDGHREHAMHACWLCLRAAIARTRRAAVRDLLAAERRAAMSSSMLFRPMILARCAALHYHWGRLSDGLRCRRWILSCGLPLATIHGHILRQGVMSRLSLERAMPVLL